MFKTLKRLTTGLSPSEGLKAYLNETKTVKVSGIRFIVRRINIYDYLDGSETLTRYYDLYRAGKSAEAESQIKKIQKHYADVFMRGVVKPKLKRKDDPLDEAIFVGDITKDLKLASELYAEIMAFTDGIKKKRLAL